jgi:hypothetical protein
MRKFLGLGLSAIMIMSFAPKANANIITDLLGVFGGSVKAGGAVNFGGLAHEHYWSFCSNRGYRSYYNRDGVLLCSYEEYVAGNMQPQGYAYGYDQICNYYFGNNAAYKWSDNTCESRSY